LNPHDGLTRFTLERFPPCPELAPFVQNYWSVRWDLTDQPPFEQEVLPHPCVNLAFEAERSAVHGPTTERFVAHLSGRGRVFGVKFKPTGFLAFARVPLTSVVARVLPLRDALRASADEADAVIDDVLSDEAAQRNLARVETFLRGCDPHPDPDSALVERLVTLAREDRSIRRATELARAGGLSVRSLHRLFERHVGLGPKWIIRRARAHHAAERVASGERVDFAALAQDLGYHDQAHFVRDFKAQVGFTPTAYAARCELTARTPGANEADNAHPG
jgi:AraC-like DNA-binding protein